MKAKYFTAGVLVAVLVIFAMGLEKTKHNRTEWEYGRLSVLSAVDSDRTYVWSGPDNEEMFPDNISNSKKLATFLSICENQFSPFNVLKHIGKDGWEIVVITDSGGTGNIAEKEYYFKRPKQ